MEQSLETSTPAKAVDTETSKIIYFLYLAGLLIGLTAIIGLVMAYTNRKDSNPDWLNSHYTFQIQTFWYGFIYLIVTILLSLIIIGWFVGLFWFIWLIIRCVNGLNNLKEQKEMKQSFFGFGN